MGIVNKLTLRHIKTHKKRSILTVLAIIVSTAMITAVFTGVYSFADFMRIRSLKNDGSWHAQYSYSKAPDFSYFDNDKDIDYYVESTRYKLDIIDDQNMIAAATPEIVKIKNIDISDGKFPKETDEILLTRDYIDKHAPGLKPGDSIRLNLSDIDSGKELKKEFTLCGIAKGEESFFTFNAGIITYNNIAENTPCVVTVRFKKLNSSVYGKIDKIAADTKLNKYAVSRNSRLLAYSGLIAGDEEYMATAGFIALIFAIIIIASITMIYSSFKASYLERERYLGMLASVGATKKQKRSSVFFEGFILGIIGIPLGVLSGYVGMDITFNKIRSDLLSIVSSSNEGDFKARLNIYIILFAVLLSALTIFFSCLVPAKKASKTSPVDAIKNHGETKIKKTGRNRTPKLTSKLFGYEGEIAVKNFNRNKKRNINIIFAFTMSAVMFLTVANFSQMFGELLNKNYASDVSDFTVTVNQADFNKLENYLKSADIDSYFAYTNEQGQIKDSDYYTPQAKKDLDLSDGYESLDLMFIDSKSFDSYAKSIGERPGKYHDKNKPRGIIYNRYTSQSQSKPKVIAAFNDDIEGKELKLKYLSSVEDETLNENYKDLAVTVGKLSDRDYGNLTAFLSDRYSPVIILPMDVYNLSVKGDSVLAGVKAKDYKQAMENAQKSLSDNNIDASFSDNAAAIKETNTILKIVRVFVFGFILLISLIAVFNIINSIAGSMTERRREFAMLKSVGVTPKGFRKMIFVENFRYGVISLLWAFPISIALHYAMNMILSKSEVTELKFTPNPQYYLLCAAAIFLIIFLSVLVSGINNKSHDNSIIEDLKEE